MIIHQYSNGQSFSCGAVLETISSLRAALEKRQVEYNVANGRMTQRVINELSDYLAAQAWKERWPIDRTVSHDAYASYFIDYWRDEVQLPCGHAHRYLLQFFFDNRQAIGTNLMKFEIASKNSFMAGRYPICIAICAEEEKIKKLGWDGGVASAQEYLEAINGAYSSFLSNPPLILSIEDLG